MIKLTTWERLTIAAIVGSMSGTVADVRRAGKVLDRVEFSEEDAKSIGLVAEFGVVDWKDKAREWDIELDNDALLLVRAQVSAWPHYRAVDRRTVGALVDKLGS